MKTIKYILLIVLVGCGQIKPTQPKHMPTYFKQYTTDYEGMYEDAGADFSADRKYRHCLWRIWDNKLKMLIVIV